MSRRVSFWIPAFWTNVFIEPLSLFSPTAPELNQPSVGSVKILFQEQENKNTNQKSERDVRLLGRFLKTKDEDKKVENFQPLSWMNTNSRFISFVCTKDSTEPTASLRILIASFELHLTKKGYSELKEILSRYTNFLPGSPFTWS